MPFYFEKNNPPVDFKYPDDKDTMVQVSVSAIHALEVTFALELLHGNFYGEFDDGMTPDIFEVFMHTPARAQEERSYMPYHSERHAFIAIIDRELFEGLDLPYNLPIMHAHCTKRCLSILTLCLSLSLNIYTALS